jgi:hypothetical protein
MKKLLILLVVGFLFQACNDDDPQPCLDGSGTVNQHLLSFDSFDEIELSGPIDLHVIQSTELQVVVDATDNVFSRLENKQSGNRIEIGFLENTCFTSDISALVTIMVPNLREIAIEGESNVTSDILMLDQLSIVVSGVGNIELNGQIITQSISSSGVMNVRNFEMLSNDVTINVSGSGDFEVSCSDNLDIVVSGTATIKYKGNPQIDQQASGTLTLTKVE